MGEESFDEEPVIDLDSEAIDFAAASQSFAEHRSLRRQDLSTLGMVQRHQGRTVPTAGESCFSAASGWRGFRTHISRSAPSQEPTVGSNPRDPRRRWFASAGKE
jgi:hypothetical protein